MKNSELDIFIKVKEEILSKAEIIGTKYFEYITRDSISPNFEFVNVKLECRGCRIDLMDRISEYGDVLDSIYLTYEEILNPKILDELIDRYKVVQSKLAKQEEKERHKKLKKIERSDKQKYERLKRKFGK